MNEVIRRLRRAAAASGDGAPTDAQLLERFVARRDEAAFAVLVRRHGPMVLGVCRRVVGHAQDAEDAFQATFLVLVRKAASLRLRDLLGAFLYGVAYRTALKARAGAVRRREKEKQVKAMPQPAAETEDGREDWQPLLDRELSRLPDKYRVPVILCDLQGQTRKEAARHLNVPEGTLSSRLATARRLLAQKLSRYGLALAGGALAAALAREASAAVPAVLTASTAKAAVVFASGTATAAVSAKVLALTEGVMKAMLLTKLKIAAVVLFLTVVVASGVGVTTLGPGTARATDPAKAEAPKPAADDDKTPKDKKAEDVEFLRRACLDVRGTPPTPLEIRYWLEDKDPDKRAKLADKLLDDEARIKKRADAIIEAWARREERARRLEKFVRERLDGKELTKEERRLLEKVLDFMEEEEKKAKQEPPAKEYPREVKPPKGAGDNADVWQLGFRFKDPVRVNVDVPGQKRKVVWYLPYVVVNPTDKEHAFIPDFELVVTGEKDAHHDEVLSPAIQKFVRQAENPRGEDPEGPPQSRNSVTIAAEPIPPAKAGAALPQGVPGLATWDDVGTDCKGFSIFVSGLSNGWATTKDQTLRRKALRLDFQRDKDGVMRFVPPAEWVYREAKEQRGDVKPKTDDEHRAERKELEARINRLSQLILDLQADLSPLRTEAIQLDEALQRPGLTETERKNLTSRRDERKEELEGVEKLLKSRFERLRQMQARVEGLTRELGEPFRP